MLNANLYRLAALCCILSAGRLGANPGPCTGNFPNPVKDICWSCIFPVSVGPVEGGGHDADGLPSIPSPCVCPFPPPVMQRVGIRVSYWEPSHIAEVVRTPLCSPFLGGTKLGSIMAPRGTNDVRGKPESSAFYHVHYFQAPVLAWVGMILSAAVCWSAPSIDLLWATELDPTWDDPELANLLNPESVLFANLPAKLACVADVASVAATRFGIDKLFWCSGAQGSLYPLSGQTSKHVSGTGTSLQLVHRILFKMHRQLMAMDVSTPAAMCSPVPQPLLRKNQYKLQMLGPVPLTAFGFGVGYPEHIWGAAKSFPVTGEDYTYLVWRKRQCCAW